MALAALGLLAATASRAGAQERIVGGGTTSAANHPWQAALVFDSRFGGSDFARAFCGGSLVTPRIVLTAAHCVVGTDPDIADNSNLDANDVDVIVGRTTLSGSGGDELNASATYFSAGYNEPTKRNDFAFISLAAPSAQARIDIADRNDVQAWQVGAPTRVSGYGATSEGGPLSDNLKVATVPVISDSACASPFVYGGIFFSDVQICAGFLAGGTDSCQGDSGGPLQTAAGPPATRLVGLVSFGSGCAEPASPGVYTRVAQNPICSAIVSNVQTIEATESIPAVQREPVLGPGGCADRQFVPAKKCKKKKKRKGRAGAVSAKKCKKKRKR